MKIAYIIVAHRDIEQIYQLIDSLSTENTWFYIHLKKTFQVQIKDEYLNRGNVKFISQRYDSGWSGYRVVLATYELLKAGNKNLVNFDSYVLLSGQCYPIKSNNYISEFLQKNSEKIFMEAIPLPDPKQVNGGLHKIRYYWFMDQFQYLNRYVRKYLHKSIHLFMKILFWKRTYIKGYTPFSGSQWWIMPGYAVKYTLKFIEENPHFMKFYKYVFCPDEQMFQSIMGNSPYRDKITGNNLRYIDWNTNGPPKTLDLTDLDKLIGSECLFARKLDMNQSKELIAELKYRNK